MIKHSKVPNRWVY